MVAAKELPQQNLIPPRPFQLPEGDPNLGPPSTLAETGSGLSPDGLPRNPIIKTDTLKKNGASIDDEKGWTPSLAPKRREQTEKKKFRAAVPPLPQESAPQPTTLPEIHDPLEYLKNLAPETIRDVTRPETLPESNVFIPDRFIQTERNRLSQEGYFMVVQVEPSDNPNTAKKRLDFSLEHNDIFDAKKTETFDTLKTALQIEVDYQEGDKDDTTVLTYNWDKGNRRFDVYRTDKNRGSKVILHILLFNKDEVQKIEEGREKLQNARLEREADRRKKLDEETLLSDQESQAQNRQEPQEPVEQIEEPYNEEESFEDHAPRPEYITAEDGTRIYERKHINLFAITESDFLQELENSTAIVFRRSVDETTGRDIYTIEHVTGSTEELLNILDTQTQTIGIDVEYSKELRNERDLLARYVFYNDTDLQAESPGDDPYFIPDNFPLMVAVVPTQSVEQWKTKIADQIQRVETAKEIQKRKEEKDKRNMEILEKVRTDFDGQLAEWIKGEFEQIYQENIQEASANGSLDVGGENIADDLHILTQSAQEAKEVIEENLEEILQKKSSEKTAAQVQRVIATLFSLPSELVSQDYAQNGDDYVDVGQKIQEVHVLFVLDETMKSLLKDTADHIKKNAILEIISIEGRTPEQKKALLDAIKTQLLHTEKKKNAQKDAKILEVAEAMERLLVWYGIKTKARNIISSFDDVNQIIQRDVDAVVFESNTEGMRQQFTKDIQDLFDDDESAISRFLVPKLRRFDTPHPKNNKDFHARMRNLIETYTARTLKHTPHEIDAFVKELEKDTKTVDTAIDTLLGEKEKISRLDFFAKRKKDNEIRSFEEKLDTYARVKEYCAYLKRTQENNKSSRNMNAISEEEAKSWLEDHPEYDLHSAQFQQIQNIRSEILRKRPAQAVEKRAFESELLETIDTMITRLLEATGIQFSSKLEFLQFASTFILMLRDDVDQQLENHKGRIAVNREQFDNFLKTNGIPVRQNLNEDIKKIQNTSQYPAQRYGFISGYPPAPSTQFVGGNR